MAALTAIRDLSFRHFCRVCDAGREDQHRPGRRRSVILRRLLVGHVLGWGVLSCSGDTTGPAALSPNQAFWALQLNQHAVNLALTASVGQPVADTVQLSATVLNANGASLP